MYNKTIMNIKNSVTLRLNKEFKQSETSCKYKMFTQFHVFVEWQTENDGLIENIGCIDCEARQKICTDFT